VADITDIRLKYKKLSRVMNERSRRIWAATEARAIGWGGVSRVAEAIGMSRNTIAAGLRELKKRGRRPEWDRGRVRNPGGGRKRLTERQPKLASKLEALVEPTTRGDPQSPLRWTTLSVRKLEEALRRDGFTVSYRTVANLLKKLNYTLQGQYKRSEGTVDHKDRDAQFRYINDQAAAQLRARLICADSGGSNGYRLQLWKRELQNFATEEKLTITVCHFPPGTSKSNRIEHRLFSFISANWRGRPLTDYRTIVNLIAGTTTKAGLTVKVLLDRRTYKRGIKVSKKEMQALNLKSHDFNGEWNYTIAPKQRSA
jgi:transposase